MRYPRLGPNGKIKALIRVLLVIHEKGEMTDIDILQSPGQMFDEEVMLLLANCPRWRPARIAGKPISQLWVQEILFDNPLLIRR